MNRRNAAFILAVASATPALAHSGPRIWIGSSGGQIVTFKGSGHGGYVDERVFVGGIDPATLQADGRLDEYPIEGTGFYATDFPGYQVRTDGQAGFTTGRSFGFELAGPLLVYDPAEDVFKTTRKRYGTPGPAPQMQLAAGNNAVKTGAAPMPGFTVMTYNAAGDHGHVVAALLGDGTNAVDGPHAVYAVPLRLTASAGLEKSKPYYLLLGRDRGYLAGDAGRAEFLAAEQAARTTLASHADWPGQWWSDAGGNWSDAARWMPDVADVPTLPAQFLSRITAPRAVTVDGRFSVGTLVFDSVHRYTLAAGTGDTGLTLHASDGVNAIRVADGSHTIAAPLALAVDANVDVAAGAALTITGPFDAASRRVAKTGGGVAEMRTFRAAALDVSAGTLAMLPGAGTSRVDQLTLGGGATFDLADNKLVTTQTPAGTATTVVGNTRLYDGLQGEVQRAKSGDAWDGNGLTSSIAATEGGLTTIGIANGAQAKGGIGATETALWGGQTITGSSILAMYTYAGDANLDGAITGDDYSAIDFGILFEGMDGYANGDFNYDGYVTGDDYSVIDLNILLQGPQIPTDGSAHGLGAVSAVPEPSACGFALLSAAMTLRRRRRRRRDRR